MANKWLDDKETKLTVKWIQQLMIIVVFQQLKNKVVTVFVVVVEMKQKNIQQSKWLL